LYPKYPASALKIAGFDTDAGLKRLSGKRDRYESLLRKFAERQVGTVEAIRAALAEGNTSTAELEAHSLKGAASTLGATTLAEVAARVEMAIRSGQNPNVALDDLSHCLAVVVEAIRTSLP
jgi:HPt (histidine-containing phosphotransfer) domain-containing protein